MEAILRTSQSLALIAIGAFRTVLAVAAICLVAGIGSTAYAQLTAPPVSTGTYTVSWTASSGGQTRAYLLEGQTRINVTGAQSRTFTKPPGTYTYRLQICFFEPEINQELCEPPGPEVTVIVTTAVVPGAPGNLAATPAYNTGNFTLSWSAVSGGVDRYEVEERVGTTGSWSVAVRPTASPISLNRPNGRYFYRVRACLANSCGGYSNTIEVTVRRLPGMPGSLGPDETVGATYTLRWAPAPGANGYEISERADSTGRHLRYGTTSASFSYHNRVVDTYRYQVRACNDVGCSPWTATKAVTVSLLSRIERLAAESIPRAKASSFLCGNGRKLNPEQKCMHKAPHGGEAFEVVEVRGWITWVAPGSNNADPDYHYDLRIDPDNPPKLLSGPLAGETIPLSLILHPGNLIEAAETDRLRGFRHPDNDRVYVGNNLKIEIHGWDVRERGQFPLDWVAANDLDLDDYIYWPFHPRRPIDFQTGVIQVGDYVRMVGTLWEDAPHEDYGQCWDGADEGGHAWYELHPVDFMARFNDFAPTPPISTGQVIAACSAGQVDVDIRPPGPRPSGMVARFEEVVRVSENTTRSVTTRTDRITVHLDVGNRFWAYYRVYWGAPPPSAPATECPIGQKCCGTANGKCYKCVPANTPCP